MAVSVTCRFCAATIRPPGGHADAVTHCPWCAKDLRPSPPAAPPTPAPRPADPAPPAPRAGGPEPVVAALILAASAVAAVAAFFAARWLMVAVG